MWISRSPNGPSVKCHVQNIHTMDELKMTGNCLKGSRGLVAFDGNWQGEEWKSLTKELLTHVRLRLYSSSSQARRRLMIGILCT
jgi:ribosome biogenesis protein BRX1